MTEELKPCPFCGGASREFQYSVIEDSHSGVARVSCIMCGASSSWRPSESGAKEAWNRRVDAPKKEAPGVTLDEDMLKVLRESWAKGNQQRLGDVPLQLPPTLPEIDWGKVKSLARDSVAGTGYSDAVVAAIVCTFREYDAQLRGKK